MAYIDTNELFKCETCRRYKGDKCLAWCENGECYSPNMKKIPTADVVPRADFADQKAIADMCAEVIARQDKEIEGLEQEIETLKDNNEHLAVMLEEAKTEVAREIFGEIERLMENNEVYFRQTDEMQEAFAKLKKKNT